MARSTALVLIFFLVFAAFVSDLQGRKLIVMTSNSAKDNRKESSSTTTFPSVFASLVFSALPKGTVPSSSPSKKGHAVLENEKLFRRHLATSVPSPGVGH